MAVGPDGFLYIADLDQKVSVIDPTTGKRIRWWGRPGIGNGEFGNDLLTIAVASDGRVYVVDRANGRIEVFAPDGTYQRQMGGFGDTEGQFHDIRFLTLGEDGSVYVPDSDTATITKFDKEGAFVWRVGGEDAPDPDLQHGVYSLTVMKDGNILATRDEGGTALLLDPSDGSVIGHWPGEELIGDSGEPSVDAAGNVYMYQYVPRAIQIFSPEGTLLGGVYFEDAIYEDYELYPAPVFTSDGHGWSFDQTLGLVELEIDLPAPATTVSPTPFASPSRLPEGTYQTAPSRPPPLRQLPRLPDSSGTLHGGRGRRPCGRSGSRTVCCIGSARPTAPRSSWGPVARTGSPMPTPSPMPTGTIHRRPST